MSEYQLLTILAAFAFLYSLVASRLERTPISGPVLYLFAGFVCGASGLQLIHAEFDGDGLKRLAEFTLALVLFTDSATANLSVLRRVKDLPVRLLLVGLPLTILAGFVVGCLFVGQLTLVEIALLATMLAPTDAALGQAVVTNEDVPASVRESLNVESGLNDGICVPVLLGFLALATGEASGRETLWLAIELPIREIGIGAAVGATLGLAGSYAIKACGKRGWIGGSWNQVPVAALAMLCFALSQRLDGSGFIGAFVGGLVFGGSTNTLKDKEAVLNGAEGAGNVLSLLTWFTFGAVVFDRSLEALSWQVVVYAVLSLTLVRMLPVFVSLHGAPVRRDTKLFLGWFGPRGLASVVFVVMVMADQLPGNDTMVAVVTWTVTLSVIVHGLSAEPLATMYGKLVRDRDGEV
ncbi:K(+)/H(+) antiporter NhaP2 [Planctomycetes bacterium Pan216]|uniref:K(+)/H(+) antiporter NhaP2 n=1 Tax=Kolteria novifilia TaxID=2527975 RepID=A0A518B1N0_9BACT|nr:K(+)/H(+) antiporter NhaP2 [Planctomycetes bacterium Pan216]